VFLYSVFLLFQRGRVFFCQVARFRDRLFKLNGEAAELQRAYEQTKTTLGTAQLLLSKLSDEKNRWDKQVSMRAV
jgi:hypothetical protein